MKKIYFFCLIFLCLGIIQSPIQAQNGSGIHLQVASYNATHVNLTWQAPSQAISCVIEYRTHYDTSFHAINNFLAGSTQLSRKSPQGPHEEFIITFYTQGGSAGGNVLRDRAGIKTTYGGVVLVEEDLYTKPVFGGCKGSSLDSLYYFVNHCLVAHKVVVCGFAEGYCIAHGWDMATYADVISPEEDEIFTNALIDDLVILEAAGHPDVHTCAYMDDLGIEIDYATRTGTAPHVRDFSVQPQPFQDFLFLKPINTPTTEGHLYITDIMGRRVWANHIGTVGGENMRIQTASWESGIYILHVENAGTHSTQKLLKR